MTNYSRIIKDQLIKTYFNLRINNTQEPYQILFRKKPLKILFILSYMRSGSSLLTHLLNTNPDIIGYGETHLKYTSEQNFKDLITKVYWQMREYKMNHTYVMDKVLHNNKFINYDFLQLPQVYSIFLLREPQRTLASICDLKPHWGQQKAVNYYGDRLSMLANYAQFINNQEHCLLLTYEQILNNTDLIFSKLQEFLQTQTDFSEKYQILSTTGVKGVGDSSENIKAGNIVRESRKLSTEISSDVVLKAKEHFDKYQTILLQYCQHI
jgi:hypothetical protein